MQSYDPEHPALQAAAAQDYAAFFAKERRSGRSFTIRPSGVWWRSSCAEEVERVQALGDAIRRIVGRAAGDRRCRDPRPHAEALGPAEGEERWHLLLRSGSRTALRRPWRGPFRGFGAPHPGARWAVDVTPISCSNRLTFKRLRPN